jgi:hypothetical protein
MQAAPASVHTALAALAAPARHLLRSGELPAPCLCGLRGLSASVSPHDQRRQLLLLLLVVQLLPVLPFPLPSLLLLAHLLVLHCLPLLLHTVVLRLLVQLARRLLLLLRLLFPVVLRQCVRRVPMSLPLPQLMVRSHGPPMPPPVYWP